MFIVIEIILDYIGDLRLLEIYVLNRKLKVKVSLMFPFKKPSNFEKILLNLKN
jgi:hypothetical protein